MPEQMTVVAVGGTVDHYDLLLDAPVAQWNSIQQYLSDEWKTGDQRRLLAIDGCLVKLSTALLQISRVRSFCDGLLRDAGASCGRDPGYAAFRGEVACADFESLLLQGRSALDRLTWFIASEFGQSCSSFRRIRNVVNNSGDNDPAASLIRILDCASPWTNGLLAKFGPNESLRDFVAHKAATTERMTNCFGLTCIGSGRVLVFDCELGDIPLLRTSEEAVQHLSYLVLNSIAACTSRETLPFENYRSKWSSQTVVFSDYAIQEPENSPLGEDHLTVVRSMHPDGFNLTTRNVRPEIWNLALGPIESR